MAAINFSQSNFDTVTSWTFNYDDHRMGIDQTKAIALCNKVNAKLAETPGLVPLTDNDLSNTKKAMIWLMSHKTYFTIADFIGILKTDETCLEKFLLAIHTPVVNSKLFEQVQELQKQIESFKAQANQVETLQQQLKKVQDREKKANDARRAMQQTVVQNPNFLSAPPNSNFQTEISDTSFDFRSNNASPTPTPNHNAPPPTAPPLITNAFPPNSTSLPRRVNVSDPVEKQLADLTKICSVLMNNSVQAGRKSIGKSRPDIYNQKEHGSLTAYAANEFDMWAGSLLLPEDESTLYFAYAFRKPIHRNHIMYLAKASDGSPRHRTVASLVQEVIKHLKLNEESIDDLQTKYCNFDICKRISMDEEFLRLVQLRRLGFPGESEAICVSHCKSKFINKLDGNSMLHSKLDSRQYNDMWVDSTNYFEISMQLRDIENKFRGKASVGSWNPPTKMECNVISCQPCHVNNIAKPNYSQNQDFNQNQSFNNVSTRTCKNPACNKPFTPARPKYLCCDMDCFKAWKGDSGDNKSNFRKRSPKKFNNMQPTEQLPSAPAVTVTAGAPATKTQAMNNIHSLAANPSISNFLNTNSSQNVSTEVVFITPAHLYSPGCKIPFVVHNSLYDTGASVSLMKFDSLVEGKLKHLMIKNRSEGILGGDQKPLVGYRGYIQIDSAIEDSIGEITEIKRRTILIFDNLNHDFIVGRDIMNTFRHVSEFPMLNKVLINPTARMDKKFNKVVAEKLRTINNLEKVAASDKYGENSTFFLNVPYSTFNNVALERYQDLVHEFCNEFLQNSESSEKMLKLNNIGIDSDSPLANVLTEGGLDGTLDTRNITVSQTKLLETTKGKVTIGAKISKEMEAKLKGFIDDYKGKVFDNSTLGKTKQVCHPEIKEDAKPFPSTPKYMPLNTFMKTEAATLVQKMVDLGVLIESTEAANSTIFIVQKSSGKWRLICDLRKYNERLADFVVHLPSPYELINKICQFELFSYVDFPEAYFNVPMSDESIKSNPIVASVSGQPKNFKFLRMAQGLSIACAKFVNLLNEIYAPVAKFVVNYLDDSVIGSNSDEETHFTCLKEFIKLTDEAGLKLSLAKSVFFATDLTFLNYTVANGAWSLSDNQRATINALNTDNLTKTKRESLAAFIQHFNKFHTNVAFASRIIRDPASSVETVKAILDNIKTKLIKSPALRSVNFENDLHIFTDASMHDCSGVILQKCKSGFELVSCFSRKFPAAVASKCIYEKELWTLHQVTKTFRYLFLGPHKKVFHQDNNAVLAAQKSKAPSLNCLFNTIQTTFTNVKFVFTPTSKNASDCFTRINNLSPDSVNALVDLPLSIFEPTQQSESSANADSSSQSQEYPVEIPDSELLPLENAAPARKSKMPQAIADKIMKIHCNTGCAAPERILLTLQGLEENSLLTRNDIESVIQNCPACKDIRNHRKPRRSAPGITIPNQTTCQEVIFIDHKKIITEPRARAIARINLDDPNFEADGVNSCLTVFEPVSKLVSFYPVKNYSAENVKIALRAHFVQNGPSQNVIADNAPCFTTLKTWLSKTFSSQLHHTSAYHPNSNLSERAHKEFEKVVKLYDATTGQYNFESWRDTLSSACISLNSLRHNLHKMSAYEIYKNRIQCDIEPVSFHPVGLEHRVKLEKFAEKVEKVYKSKLKIKLPVFLKGQQIKCDIPNQPVRYGIVTSTADHEFKLAVRIKFGKQRPVAISKNFICVPRNGVSVDPNNIDIQTNQDGFDTITNPIPPETTASSDDDQREPPLSETIPPSEFPFAQVPFIEETALDDRTARRQRRGRN